MYRVTVEFEPIVMDVYGESAKDAIDGTLEEIEAGILDCRFNLKLEVIDEDE